MGYLSVNKIKQILGIVATVIELLFKNFIAIFTDK